MSDIEVMAYSLRITRTSQEILFYEQGHESHSNHRMTGRLSADKH
jgi:hypothetical protein